LGQWIIDLFEVDKKEQPNEKWKMNN
jgi:hypothetical protein